MSLSNRSFDLDYRPRTYFWPLGLKPHPLSSIKGANRRKLIAGVLADDPDADIPPELLQPALPDPLRQHFGRMHPSEMGGEYLPDLVPQEVEIGRITIASTTQDVACVYARQAADAIAVRVVDEYDGDTLSSTRSRKCPEPLSLRQFTNFFLRKWNLLDVLRMNFEGEWDRPEKVLRFFWASSDFYPEFDDLLRYRVRKWAKRQLGLWEGQDEANCITPNGINPTCAPGAPPPEALKRGFPPDFDLMSAAWNYAKPRLLTKPLTE